MMLYIAFLESDRRSLTIGKEVFQILPSIMKPVG